MVPKPGSSLRRRSRQGSSTASRRRCCGVLDRFFCSGSEPMIGAVAPVVPKGTRSSAHERNNVKLLSSNSVGNLFDSSLHSRLLRDRFLMSRPPLLS
jgi:hypothetical protein